MTALSRRRAVALAALAALLLPALSPAFVAARYLADPVAFAAVCRTAPPAAADSQPPPPAGHAAPCVFCLPGGVAPALPSSAPPFFPPPAAAVPALALREPARSAAARSHALPSPRAPPAGT
jgi:hypothetical protein